MDIRYDFNEHLDLRIMRKQLSHYIGKMPELKYQIYLKDFRIEIDIIQNVDDTTSTYHEVRITMFDMVRSSDLISAKYLIIPSLDMRFNEIPLIKSMYDFKFNSANAHFKSNNASDTVDKLCNLIKLVHKINRLKAFL